MRYRGDEPAPSPRLWNTFAAHRLLHWALVTHGSAAQTRLKLALFDAHFQQRRDVSDEAVLLDVVQSLGFDRDAAQAAFGDPAIARQVRTAQADAVDREITAVPAMIINRTYLIPGAQEPETYTAMLRRVVARQQRADAG